MAQPKILLTRIDDRFIYGQDVELWNEAGFAPMGTHEGGGARRRLDAVFLGAKDRRHHSYRNAASMDSDYGGLTRRCARAG